MSPDEISEIVKFSLEIPTDIFRNQQIFTIIFLPIQNIRTGINVDIDLSSMYESFPDGEADFSIITVYYHYP